MEANTSFTTFLDGCQKLCDKNEQHYEKCAKYRTITIEANFGKKFRRVARVERVKDSGELITQSAHCFVAVSDGYNKKLGNWNAGDVFKADGWVGPARGVRGNIFDQTNGLNRMSAYGCEYNR